VRGSSAFIEKEVAVAVVVVAGGEASQWQRHLEEALPWPAWWHSSCRC